MIIYSQLNEYLFKQLNYYSLKNCTDFFKDAPPNSGEKILCPPKLREKKLYLPVNLVPPLVHY